MGIIYYCDNITIIKFFQNFEGKCANELNLIALTAAEFFPKFMWSIYDFSPRDCPHSFHLISNPQLKSNLSQITMVYIQHCIDEPRAWQRPISKVYDANRVSGEFYYRVNTTTSCVFVENILFCSQWWNILTGKTLLELKMQRWCLIGLQSKNWSVH